MGAERSKTDSRREPEGCERQRASIAGVGGWASLTFAALRICRRSAIQFCETAVCSQTIRAISPSADPILLPVDDVFSPSPAIHHVVNGAFVARFVVVSARPPSITKRRVVQTTMADAISPFLSRVHFASNQSSGYIFRKYSWVAFVTSARFSAVIPVEPEEYDLEFVLSTETLTAASVDGMLKSTLPPPKALSTLTSACSNAIGVGAAESASTPARRAAFRGSGSHFFTSTENGPSASNSQNID